MRHRPFTKHSFPQGNMPDIPPTEETLETKITLLKEAIGETLRQLNVQQLEVVNLNIERANMIDEGERLESRIKALKKEIAGLQLEAYEETDTRFKTGG